MLLSNFILLYLFFNYLSFVVVCKPLRQLLNNNEIEQEFPIGFDQSRAQLNDLYYKDIPVFGGMPEPRYKDGVHKLSWTKQEKQNKGRSHVKEHEIKAIEVSKYLDPIEEISEEEINYVKASLKANRKKAKKQKGCNFFLFNWFA